MNLYDKLCVMLKEDGEILERVISTVDLESLKTLDTYNAIPGSEYAFTIWGERWVYFPVVGEQSTTVGHALRNPCDISMEPQYF